MSETLDPRLIFELLQAHVPSELQPHLLVVGSLAAAYHFRDRLKQSKVNTKDCDAVVQPAGAIDACRAIALKLLSEKWRRAEGCFARPSPTHENLRAIRLWPPAESPAYFLELLALPEENQEKSKIWIPIELDDGWYGLPSFRFMGVAAHRPETADNGVRYAAPCNMALANLLSHPEIGTARIEERPDGLLRSAKDLGRVLALAQLAGSEDTLDWPDRWDQALRGALPLQREHLRRTVGKGLRELLLREDALEDARHAVDVGLLAGYGITRDALKAICERLFADAIEPYERG